MKYTLIHILRRLRLLALADAVRFATRHLGSWRANRRFKREYPDFPTPPPHLAYDAYNRVDWPTYLEQGLRHARIFVRIIDEHLATPTLNVLEWGCGPGRLIRHLPALLNRRQATLTGADCNPESIAWCRDHIPGIQFLVNDMLPPFLFEDDRFDVIYCFSVFTHLSEDAQSAWAEELRRVLKPGGLLICTTHGERYRYLLADARERQRFDEGRLVTQGNYPEGRKWFLAFHPPASVRGKLLRGFTDVQQVMTSPEDLILQDVWIGWKGFGDFEPRGSE